MDNLMLTESGRMQLHEPAFRQRRDMLNAEQETLRRATLLKQRKVSTQLKLDTIRRQMINRHRPRSTCESDDATFYREQAEELADELERISMTLAKAEKEAYFARKRLLRCSGIDCLNLTSPMSASQPITSKDRVEQRLTSVRFRPNLLNLRTPTLRKKISPGELRAVASLSSLSSSCVLLEQQEASVSANEDHKLFKSPLKVLGDFMDSHILSKFLGSNRKTKSAENIPKIESVLVPSGNSTPTLNEQTSDVANERISEPIKFGSAKGNVERRKCVEDSIKNEEPTCEKTNKANEIDPKVLAEIEEFEKMAAHYIREHSEKNSPS